MACTGQRERAAATADQRDAKELTDGGGGSGNALGTAWSNGAVARCRPIDPRRNNNNGQWRRNFDEARRRDGLLAENLSLKLLLVEWSIGK
ncbi:hypothetical protein Scep_009412 [Stephania cephalantha]|uniref:Uncharacterized protein n=1 Tax=Stephania cephalantha TaxID=152367 RepID=A0AAP0JT48_9MAGN